MEGVNRTTARVLCCLALSTGLLLFPSAASAAASGSPPVVVDPTPDPSGSAVTDDTRRGGTPGEPEHKPAWVWVAGAALLLALGAGGVRYWRNREELITDDGGFPGGA